MLPQNIFKDFSIQLLTSKDKRNKIILLLLLILSFTCGQSYAFVPGNDKPDTVGIYNRLGIEIRPEYILPTNAFFRGDNERGKRINHAFSAHLKYSFNYNPNSLIEQVYSGSYQGIGFSYHNFGENKYLGTPIAAYLFQGAKIAQLNKKLSFNYEWNFGASFGWKPYNEQTNSYNGVIGSKVNAYLNVNFYLNYILSRYFDLTTGLTLAHFSNGNTKIPNAGLNTTGMKIGLIYNFNRKENTLSNPYDKSLIPEYPPHINYDLIFFGSWRRTGVLYGDKYIASPDAYTVLGLSFAPMYNFGYKFRAGVSFDGIYDTSANVYTEDKIVPLDGNDKDNNDGPTVLRPSFRKQVALGLSARSEYVMPFFIVGIGMGTNVLHGGGDLKGFYQNIALKIDVTKSSFIHIGYNLKNFRTPNYLMLGFGFRFHNKCPSLR